MIKPLTDLTASQCNTIICAVLQQSVQDYCYATFLIEDYNEGIKQRGKAITDVDVAKANDDLKEIDRFLQSDFFDFISPISARDFKKRLNAKVDKARVRRKELREQKEIKKQKL